MANSVNEGESDHSDILFEIEDLEIKYDDETVLRVPRLLVDRGRMTCVLGESGAGKTTFLDTLSLLNNYREFKGEIKYFHKNGSAPILYSSIRTDEKRLAEMRRDHFSYVFQESHFFPGLSLDENVRIPRLIKSQPIDIDQDPSESLYKDLQIEKFKSKQVNKLSGGEKQRTALVRAVLTQNDVLFCDEPTGNLGDNDAAAVMAAIRDYIVNSEAKKSAIVITHNINLAVRHAHNVILISDRETHMISEENFFCRTIENAWHCVYENRTFSEETFVERLKKVFS